MDNDEGTARPTQSYGMQCFHFISFQKKSVFCFVPLCLSKGWMSLFLSQWAWACLFSLLAEKTRIANKIVNSLSFIWNGIRHEIGKPKHSHEWTSLFDSDLVGIFSVF